MNKTTIKRMKENGDVCGLLDALNNHRLRVSRPVFHAVRELDLDEIKRDLLQGIQEGRGDGEVERKIDAISALEALMAKCEEWSSTLPECFQKSREDLLHQRLQHYQFLHFDGTWDEHFEVTT
jgi:hypothetical protein